MEYYASTQPKVDEEMNTTGDAKRGPNPPFEEPPLLAVPRPPPGPPPSQHTNKGAVIDNSISQVGEGASSYSSSSWGAIPPPPPPPLPSLPLPKAGGGLKEETDGIENIPSFLPAEVAKLFSDLMMNDASKARGGGGGGEGGEKHLTKQSILYIGNVAGRGQMSTHWEGGRGTLSLDGEWKLWLKEDQAALVFSVPLHSVSVMDIIEEGTLVAFEVEIAGGGIVQLRGEDLKSTINWLELLTSFVEDGAANGPKASATAADDDDDSIIEQELTDSRKSRKCRAQLRSLLHKPRIPLRKLELYVNWINSLHVWRTPVEVAGLAREMANGLLLCSLMEKLVPGTKHIGIHKKPLTHQAAVRNLELGLRIVWKSRKVNNVLIPSAEDIYQRKSTRVADLVSEVFEVYVMRDLRKEAPTILRWFDAALQHYGRRLSPDSLVYPFKGLWEQMQDGLSLFCVLFHYCGPKLVIKQGDNADQVARKLDPSRICQKPKNLKEFRTNVQECFLIMKASDIEVVWNVDDWIAFPDKDFILYQLKLVYDRFRSSPCALPYAHGYIGGLAPGPHGKPNVSGMEFAESKNGNDRDSNGRPHDVSLGDGRGQTLLKVPIYETIVQSAAKAKECRKGAVVDTFSSTLRYRGLKSALALNMLQQKEKKWCVGVNGSPDSSKSLLYFRGIQHLKRREKVLHYTEQTGLSTEEFQAAMKRIQKDREREEERLNLELKLLEQQFIYLESQAPALTEEAYKLFHEETERGREFIFQEGAKIEREFQSKLSDLEQGRFDRTDSYASPKTKASAPRSSLPRQVEGKELAQKEKTWVKSNRAKTSHNHRIERLQRISEEHLRTIMERCRINAKRRFGRAGGPKQQQMEESEEGEGTFEDAWQTFKGQLEHYHNDWLKRLNEEEQRVASLPLQQTDQHPAFLDDDDMLSEDENEGPQAAPSVTPEDDERLDEIMHIIRVEELYWMAQEEERMKRYLASLDKAPKEQASPSKQALPRHSLTDRTSRLATLPSGEEYDEVEGDERLQWLMLPRKLGLMERDTERYFEFSVVRLSSLLPADQSPTPSSSDYAFKWSSGESEPVAGFVAIKDIWECIQSEKNPKALIISLTFKNPQAICHSGGLSVVVVCTQSAAQTARYCEGINALMKAL